MDHFMQELNFSYRLKGVSLWIPLDLNNVDLFFLF